MEDENTVSGISFTDAVANGNCSFRGQPVAFSVYPDSQQGALAVDAAVSMYCGLGQLVAVREVGLAHGANWLAAPGEDFVDDELMRQVAEAARGAFSLYECS